LVGEHGLATRPPVRVGRDVGGQTCGAGAGVEVVDDRVGGSQEQAVAPGVVVGQPRRKRGVRGGLVGADVNAPGVDVEADPGRVAAAQRQRRRGLGAGVKPHDFRQRQRPGLGGDVAQHPASGDRRQLAVISNQPHTRALALRVSDHRVQTCGRRHAGLIDDDQRVRSDVGEPLRCSERRGVVRIGAVDVLVEGVGGRAQVLPEHDRRGRGRGQSEDMSARAAPRMRQCGHGGGLARPGRRQGKFYAASAKCHLGHEGGLALVEGFAACVGVGECQTHVLGGRDTAIQPVRRGQNSGLGSEHVAAGEFRDTVAAVDA
jgi:hypothetical protein